jgi:hypothetical protein
MLLASTINKPKFSAVIFFLLGSLYVSAQQNSPFSRFGLGDVLPNGHITNRAMGGLSAPYVDGQSVNFANPASYSRLNLVTYDIGLTIDARTLRSKSPVSKYNTVNFTPSYVVLGLPLTPRKLKNRFGMAIGLRPVTSINYSVQEKRKIRDIDSVTYLYEGSGGLNEAFIGFAKEWNGFRLGVNAGYLFGRKETSTKTFITDTVAIPAYSSNSATTTSFHQLYVKGGFQYEANIGKKLALRLGVAGNLKQKLTAEQDLVRETFYYNTSGTAVPFDSIYKVSGTPGTIELPATINAGFMLVSTVEDNMKFRSERASFGVEYEATNWSNYRSFGQSDNLGNAWAVKIGGQFTPNPLPSANYWDHVTYRAGFNFGKDQVVVSNNQYSTYTAAIGAGFPIRKWRSYDNQFTNINTAFEFGRRGSSTTNIRESFFRFSLGLSLSDVWFQKRKYD